MIDQAEAVESEIVEATAPEGEVQAETVENEQQETTSEAEEPRFVEIEIDGKVYEIPEELKDGYLRQSDYTKKTQEIAEGRKAFETEREAFSRQQQEIQQRVQLQQQNLQGYAHLAALDAQIQQYQNVDWASLIDNDPVEAQKLQWQFNQLKEQRNGIAHQISNTEQQAAQQHQQALAKVVAEGRATLEREISGWSEDTVKQLRDYGQAQGFQAEELAQVYDPRQVKVLHKAYLYDQMMQKAQAKPEKVETTPTRKVSAGRTSTKDPEKMSTEEWLNWRNKQLRD